MELKKGMYVRINNDFRLIYVGIGRITKIVDDTVYIQIRDMSVSFPKDQIEKASFNLIDLIEVGDYVNEMKVEEVNNNLSEHKGICNCLDTYLWYINELDEFEEIVIFENDIKSVVTKEQFDLMKYVVEDEK